MRALQIFALCLFIFLKPHSQHRISHRRNYVLQLCFLCGYVVQKSGNLKCTRIACICLHLLIFLLAFIEYKTGSYLRALPYS